MEVEYSVYFVKLILPI